MALPLHMVRRSTFDSLAEAQCFQGIVDWMVNAPTSAKYPHAKMDSWFYWAYNPDSGGEVPGRLCSVMQERE